MARDLYRQAAELFGFDENDTDNLLDELEELGFNPKVNTLSGRGKFAGDIAEIVGEMYKGLAKEIDLPASSRFKLDTDWEYGEDEWLEAGEEVEMTIDYEESVR